MINKYQFLSYIFTFIFLYARNNFLSRRTIKLLPHHLNPQVLVKMRERCFLTHRFEYSVRPRLTIRWHRWPSHFESPRQCHLFSYRHDSQPVSLGFTRSHAHSAARWRLSNYIADEKTRSTTPDSSSTSIFLGLCVDAEYSNRREIIGRNKKRIVVHLLV